MATDDARLASWCHGRFGVRLVAAMLLVSLPLMVVLAVLLTSQASASLTDVRRRTTGSAMSPGRWRCRLEDWLSERRENLTVIAGQASAGWDSPAAADAGRRCDRTYGDFQSARGHRPTGKVLASSRPGGTLILTGQELVPDGRWRASR